MHRGICLAIILAASLGELAQGATLLICGGDTVFALDAAAAVRGKLERTWSWQAAQCQQLREAMRPRFKNTNECKPIDGGAKVLITSSSGGCALVERPSGKLLWYAQLTNPHSLEVLPRQRIVVASSVHDGGNRLVLFDIAHSNQPIFHTPLRSAHGVVWDGQRQLLWAIGGKELRSYELVDWETEKPSLALKRIYPLPDSGAHDLQPLPRSSDLIVTTNRHVYLFDRDQQKFRLHPILGGVANGKSVSIDPANNRVVYAKATESTWTDTLRLLNPTSKIQLPGERLYKARWITAKPAE